MLKIIFVFHILAFTSILELAHLQDSKLVCTPRLTSPVLISASSSVTRQCLCNSELSSVTNIHVTAVFNFFPEQFFSV